MKKLLVASLLVIFGSDISRGAGMVLAPDGKIYYYGPVPQPMIPVDLMAQAQCGTMAINLTFTVTGTDGIEYPTFLKKPDDPFGEVWTVSVHAKPGSSYLVKAKAYFPCFGDYNGETYLDIPLDITNTPSLLVVRVTNPTITAQKACIVGAISPPLGIYYYWSCSTTQ